MFQTTNQKWSSIMQTRNDQRLSGVLRLDERHPMHRHIWPSTSSPPHRHNPQPLWLFPCEMWKVSAATYTAFWNVSEIHQNSGHALARNEQRGIGAMAPVDVWLVEPHFQVSTKCVDAGHAMELYKSCL